MREQGHLVHFVPGRLRIKVPSRQGDAAYFEQLQDSVSALPQVREVTSNAATGSLLVHHSWSSAKAFAEDSRRHGLFELTDNGAKPPWRQPQSSVEALDQPRKASPQSAFGVRQAIFTTLMVMGVYQLLRGEIVAPAVTLFWYAMQLTGLPGESAGGELE